MSNISDLIEQFILQQMDTDDSIDLSRNELAHYFNVAPSQINYVLSTRFSSPRGFVIESRRGGGGYVRVVKINYNDNLSDLISNQIGDQIDYTSALGLINNLCDKGIINDSERLIIISAITPKALANPIKFDNKLRANILKNILINYMGRD